MKNIKIGIVYMGILFSLAACKKEVVLDAKATNSSQENSNTAESVSTNASNKMVKDLPAEALSFINKHFTDTGIASYETKNIVGLGKSYEVKLNNGVEVTFDKLGAWKEISDGRGIDSSLIPESIKRFVDQNYKGTFINSIEKDNKSIKVDLANDIDLEFDANGGFVRIDK